ncbi:MAG: transcriptional regulator [Deltaproteobacteria bacterium CG11_big_fil_rev_8_21_14_0_20_49_13]|nr:MAG: transcriptional regulator [Deltaproteobacteria bacterium CG11_big_fil_rev_8_21_14_0_20_49_13]
MKPKESIVKSKHITGICVRTKNEKEMNPSTAQLPRFWGKFHQEELISKIPYKLSSSPVYGVYHNYETDLNGEYSVIAGVETDGRDDKDNDYSSVRIEDGKYLVFEGRGAMPVTVINIWKTIWEYFSSPDVPKRAYTTDYEVYKGPDEVAIYIAIK